MPRRARFALAGISWHIIQRGNDRAVWFHLALFCAHLIKSAFDEIRNGTNDRWGLRGRRVRVRIEAAPGRRAIRGT